MQRSALHNSGALTCSTALMREGVAWIYKAEDEQTKQGCHSPMSSMLSLFSAWYRSNSCADVCDRDGVSVDEGASRGWTSIEEHA